MHKRRDWSQADATRQAEFRPRFSLPAWLLSVVLHASLLVGLVMAVRLSPQGAADEPSRSVGIVLKHRTADEDDFYEGPDQQLPADAENQPAEAGHAAAPAAASLQETAPVDVARLLEPAEALLAPGAATGQWLPSAADLADGRAAPTAPSEGRARTSVFGLEGEGYKFVYVFDRSGSMGGSGRSALSAARAELKASLESLGPTHQFQIIFYNDRPLVFALAGEEGRLVFGDEPNKAQAHRFIDHVTADGATDHLPALWMALELRPDVIFFLTDADEPSLSNAQLKKIVERNNGRTSINAIEFGLGPPLGRENFLMRLARENGGGHAYVDVTRLGRPRP